MKTAFSSFIYSRKGIYGILHVLILCLSLFLIISISMDTFHNIPFINQGSYLRIQFWICMFFLFDFLLEFFLAPDKWRYLSSHFVFFAGFYSISEYHRLLSHHFFSGGKLFSSFYTSSKRRVCAGHCGGVALGKQSFGFVHFLYHYVDGDSLFCQSDIFCAGA